MNINQFSGHIFWSYKKNADLPVETIIKRVVAYGEISDFIILTKNVSKNIINSVLNSWEEKEKYDKAIHFIKNVIL
ncbi:hypothetical protein ACFLSA_03235 [Bacteroidota bacterium]